MSRLRTYLDDLRTLPADAALAYRREGLPGIWTAVASRSLSRLARYDRLIVFAHPLDHTLETWTPPGIVIREISQLDESALGSLIGQRELARFQQLLACGRHCLVAWRGLIPVGYAWVAERIGPDVSLWPLPFEFPLHAAYLWNLYVVPGERGNGVGSALATARLRLARDRGFREGWRMVASGNAASLRTVRKPSSGFRVVGEVRYLRLLHTAYARFIPAPVPSN